jgi:hypothetical protein
MNVAADVRAPQRVQTATGRGRGPSLMGHHRDQLIEFLNALGATIRDRLQVPSVVLRERRVERQPHASPTEPEGT